MQHCTHSFSLVRSLHSLQCLFTILHKLESECHENLCLCSKSLTMLNAIYLQLNTKPQRSCTGWLAPSWPQTTATAVYFQSIPRILSSCQKYSILYYVWHIPLLQLHPYLSNFLFLGRTDLLNRKKKKKKKRVHWRTCNKYFKPRSRQQTPTIILQSFRQIKYAGNAISSAQLVHAPADRRSKVTADRWESCWRQTHTVHGFLWNWI